MLQIARVAAWVTLAIILATIVMGAVVRATHSGDGCGRSWPGCEGGFVMPGTSDTAHLIEFSHRAISGVSLLAMLLLVVLVFRAFVPGHAARKAVLWSMGLLTVEALIGAMIVLYGWVTDDRSVARQVAVPLHLVNTFLLTASVGLTVWVICGRRMPQLRARPRIWRQLLALGGLMLLIAATGATTSLADTLFAVDSVVEGLRQDFSRESEVIVQLRIMHPIIAVTGGLVIAWFAWRHLSELERRGIAWPAWLLIGGVGVQAVLGATHIALLTPLATGLLHLAIAQGLWLALIAMALTLLEPREDLAPAR